jgi:YD repeat-containing protein
MRLGAVNGPKLEFFSLNQKGVAPVIDRQLYVNGRLSSIENGSIELGRAHQTFGKHDILGRLVSNEHGTIRVDDATGKYTYTDHSANGTWIKHSDGKVERIRNSEIELKTSDELRLGDENGPLVKIFDAPGRELASGTVLYRHADVDLIARGDGRKILDDRAGARVTLNKEGQVISAESVYGTDRTYEYGDKGQLKGIKFADGSHWTSEHDTTWRIANKGQPETHISQTLSVERDGSLKYEYPDGKAMIKRLDGSTEVHWPGRHIEYKDANLAVETQKLEALSKYHFSDQGQSKRFVDLMREIEKRGLPPMEVAETYRQVNRLLSASEGAKVSPKDRASLAEQIMYSTAYPHSIDQGYNNTCNVTTLETRAFERDPAKAARMIADVAITGKYTTPAGVVVDIERVGGLIPDAESNRLLQAGYVNGQFGDIKVDGGRTYAGQLFENTAVNIHYADVMSNFDFSRGGYVYQKGDVIQYMKDAVSPGSKGTGEKLVAFRLAADGRHRQMIEIDDSPHIYTGELGLVYDRIVPAKDLSGAPTNGNHFGIVLGGPQFKWDPKVLSASSPQELESMLLAAKKHDRLPIVLHVDSRDPVFSTNNKVGGYGGAHVITVENIYSVVGPDGNPVYKIDLYNQWGLKHNRVGKDAVNSSDLYRATLRRDENGKIVK